MNRLLTTCAFVLMATAASAQSEDVEPRVIGTAGSMSLGLAGFVDRFSSPEETFPLNATLHIDVTRFLTANIAVRGGIVGTASFGGDEDSERPVGPGVPALHAIGGGFFYFTPLSLMSPYAGVEYRGQLTQRAERDSGTMLGKGGLAAAVSSRVLVFLEGGYGARLTRGEDDELQWRVVGEVGFRIRF